MEIDRGMAAAHILPRPAESKPVANGREHGRTRQLGMVE